MNITFVFDGLQFGGIERVGVEYIKLLSDRNYAITVVNLRPNLNAMEKEIPTDVRILHIPFSRNLAPQRYSKLVRVLPMGAIAFYICAIPVNAVQKIYKIKYKKMCQMQKLQLLFRVITMI